MNLLIYLAGMVTFLFAFFFFAAHTDEHPSFIYLQYTSILVVFYIVGLGFVDYTRSRPEKFTKSQKMEARRDAWFEQRKHRRAKRRFR